VSLEFYIDTVALGLTQPVTEMSIRNISWGYRRPVRRANNLTTFMCRLPRNLGASTSWNPQVLSRPVLGLLYLSWNFVRKIASFFLLRFCARAPLTPGFVYPCNNARFHISTGLSSHGISEYIKRKCDVTPN